MGEPGREDPPPIYFHSLSVADLTSFISIQPSEYLITLRHSVSIFPETPFPEALFLETLLSFYIYKYIYLYIYEIVETIKQNISGQLCVIYIVASQFDSRADF